MNDPFLEHVKVGDRPQADHINRLVDLANRDVEQTLGFWGTEGVYAAMRPGMTFTDKIPHRPNVVIPPYGIITADAGTTNDFASRLTLSSKLTTTLLERPIYVNLDQEVASGALGYCKHAMIYPIRVAYDTVDADGIPGAGQQWGPVPASAYIRQGVPGFWVLKTDGDNSGYVWVMYEVNA